MLDMCFNYDLHIGACCERERSHAHQETINNCKSVACVRACVRLLLSSRSRARVQRPFEGINLRERHFESRIAQKYDVDELNRLHTHCTML